MKVVILIGQYLPKHVGGTEYATNNISKHLTDRGHEVHILTRFDKDIPKIQIEDGVIIHRIFTQSFRVIEQVHYWMRGTIAIKKISPSVVLVQGIGLGIPAIMAQKLWNIPCIIYGRGGDVYSVWPGKNYLAPVILRNANGVIALTNDMAKEIKKIFNREILVLPNGINSEKFQNLQKPGSTGPVKKIICVARLINSKGIPYLIDAMKEIHTEYPNIQLILAGDGPDRDELSRYAHNLDLDAAIIFTGTVANADIPPLLADADIFIFPSLSEGFPNVLLEAMASGLPVIATNVGGIPEIIEEGENGYLVPPKSSDDIVIKLKLLLTQKKLIEYFSHNNQKKAREYDWNIVTEKLETIMMKLL